jgi:acyl-CoA thioesterase-2
MKPLQQLIERLQVSHDVGRQFIGQASASDVHVYGGLILTQAIDAAKHCCPDTYSLQSLHGQFLRPGIVQEAINIRVEDLKDGRRFKVYNVYCQQQGKTIFFATVTFHLPEDSFQHTQPAPPLTLPADDKAHLFIDRTTPITPDQRREDAAVEVRIDNPNQLDQALDPEQVTWFKTSHDSIETASLTDWQQTLLLAYCSDWNMPTVAIRPHIINTQQRLKIASLDHSICFYQQANLDNWVACVQQSPAASGGRGHSRGLFYSEHGELLASVNQESFMVTEDKP